MKRYLAILLLSGCVASNSLQYDATAETNLYHIAKTRKGMSEKEVLAIMHKPYKYETFEVGDDTYDVWFYVTRTTGLDQTRMVPQNLTPLTFKNGVLVGSGYSWYYYAMREQAALCPEAPKTPTQEEQDREFEKNLRAPAPNTPPPAATSKAPEVKTAAATPKVVKAQAAPKSVPPPLKERANSWAPTPLGAVQKTKLAQVKIGMTETEVTNLIGQPTDYKSYKIDSDVYDIWFYEAVTATGDMKSLPLTFKNSVLVSTSTKYYKDIKSKAESQNNLDSDSENMINEESQQNFNFW